MIYAFKFAIRVRQQPRDVEHNPYSISRIKIQGIKIIIMQQQQ